MIQINRSADLYPDADSWLRKNKVERGDNVLVIDRIQGMDAINALYGSVLMVTSSMVSASGLIIVVRESDEEVFYIPHHLLLRLPGPFDNTSLKDKIRKDDAVYVRSGSSYNIKTDQPLRESKVTKVGTQYLQTSSGLRFRLSDGISDDGKYSGHYQVYSMPDDFYALMLFEQMKTKIQSFLVYEVPRIKVAITDIVHIHNILEKYEK